MTAEAEIKGSNILPGTFGTAVLKAAALEKATIVPLAAVRTDADGSRHVLVLDGGQQKKVAVTLFAVDGTQAVLSNGPAAGDKIVLP
jgi:hypothetical protein